jgi:small subunit ribosomal protein S6
MQNYETIFIAAPELTEDEQKALTAKFVEVLTKNQAEIVNHEEWGLRKLAYPIQKKNNGYYTLLEFKSPTGSLVSTLETEYRRDERIIRFQTVRLDKYAVQYNERRRNKVSNKATQEV